ncbi:MAG: ABC transporter permease subunit [Tepidisphaeraceae bacterium]|jgi:ABC-type Na+ efflux pump permease subunit
MSWYPLLKTMVFKEVRTSLRERQQVVGLVVLLLVLLFMAGTGATRFRALIRASATTRPTTQATTLQAQFASQALLRPHLTSVRWAAVLAGSGVGVFVSLGLLLAAALATFAGEKDSGTLEVLLASPVEDTKLYLLKCISVLLPSAVLGYLFLLVPGALAMFLLRTELAAAPINLPFYVLVLSAPPVLLSNLILVAIAAAVSAKTSSLKGASQVFGAIMCVIIFTPTMILPAVCSAPAVRQWLARTGGRWITQGFAVQYVAVLVVLTVVAVICLAIGRAFFRRDRLLA